jgi:hypothetical protein
MSSSDSMGLNAMKYKIIDGLKIRYACSQASGSVHKVQDPILLLSPWPESIYAFLPTWEVLS